MKKKLIITESQLKRLKSYIVENAHALAVKQLKTELDMNYAPVNNFVKEGGEYSEIPMIQIKLDEEQITHESLYKYLGSKHNFNKDFIKQVINDWVFSKITDDYQLSKNVPLH